MLSLELEMWLYIHVIKARIVAYKQLLRTHKHSFNLGDVMYVPSILWNFINVKPGKNEAACKNLCLNANDIGTT
jgi:hypothetical protein